MEILPNSSLLCRRREKNSPVEISIIRTAEEKSHFPVFGVSLNDFTDRGAALNIPTIENLFEHKCQIKDMKLSGFNPETLTFYCQECGGKLTVKRTKSVNEYIEKHASLKLTKKMFDLSE